MDVQKKRKTRSSGILQELNVNSSPSPRNNRKSLKGNMKPVELQKKSTHADSDGDVAKVTLTESQLNNYSKPQETMASCNMMPITLANKSNLETCSKAEQTLQKDESKSSEEQADDRNYVTQKNNSDSAKTIEGNEVVVKKDSEEQGGVSKNVIREDDGNSTTKVEVDGVAIKMVESNDSEEQVGDVSKSMTQEDGGNSTTKIESDGLVMRKESNESGEQDTSKNVTQEDNENSTNKLQRKVSVVDNVGEVEEEGDLSGLCGIISKEALEEEQKAKDANIQNERSRSYYNKDTSDIPQEKRYDMLMGLLNKSSFFTKYIEKKLQDGKEFNTVKDRKVARRRKKKEELAKKNNNVLQEQSTTGKGKRKRSLQEPEDDDEERTTKKAKAETRSHGELEISDRQPLLLTGGVMRNYQLEGFEWLAKLYENGINGILADEMGLGKTIQCIALFCHLYEFGISGPFIVVAPLSTVPNWINEFRRFAPDVPTILYHGTKEARAELRKQIGKCHKCDIVPKMHTVVVTSYEIAMNDRPMLANVNWKFLVVDEGHRLKNMECRLIRELKMYDADHRLLLTGTPLQNNMRELFSLLNFVLPDIFDDVQVFESWFDAKEIHENEENVSKEILAQEQKRNVISMLHQILLPFLRRRVKADVGLEIPPKKEVLVFCPLTQRQKEMYEAVLEKTIAQLVTRKNEEEEVDPETLGKGKRSRPSIDYSQFDKETSIKDDDKFEEFLQQFVKKTHNRDSSAYKMRIPQNEIVFCIKNRMMDLRKAVNHPYLIEYPVTDDGFYKIDEDVVSICGKLKVLDQMLSELIKRGHKVLLFTQMTRLLDILGDYLNHRQIKFSRLDGSMSFLDRQENIDNFNTDETIPLFLLSTRAGGLGINLTAADTCVIYDSDWNPQQDLQAQDRCHRLGQTKPVMVYRLVTKGTIDEKIVQRAAAKRKIEKLVIHKDKFNSLGNEASEKASTRVDAAELLRLLASKDHVGAITCEEGDVLSDGNLNKLLDRSDLTWARQKDGSSQESPAPKPDQEVTGIFRVLEEEDNADNGLQSIGE